MPNWAKGDAFNYNSLPANLKSQMVQTQLTELNYAGYTGQKAVAIADNGLGFVRRNMTAPQAEVNKAALESCFAVSGKPCALLAVGNAFEVSRNDLNNAFTFNLAAPASVTATTIPFLFSSAAATAASGYNAGNNPKAMAISLDGTYMWVAYNGTDNPIASVADARRMALERCEMAAAFSPCTIFVENASFVFQPASINRTPVINYAATTVANPLPGAGASSSSLVNQYLGQVPLLNSVLYITANGNGGAAWNNNAATAESEALSFCQQRESNKFPCFRYAINRNVQSLVPNLVAVKSFALNIHCKVVPRATCAHHRAMGCPAGGPYYTVNAGQIATELCP